jgi:hypothetical protein
MSLLKEIADELDTARKAGDATDHIIDYAIRFVKGYVKAISIGNEDARRIVEIRNNLTHIDISPVVGKPKTYLSIQSTGTKLKTAQYMEREGRSHIVLYDDTLFGIVTGIKQFQPVAADEFDQHRRMIQVGKFAERLNSHYDDLVHEVAHMLEGVDWEEEKRKIRTETDPLKIRQGADPSNDSSVDELNRAIEQTRKELYARSSVEKSANFVTGLTRLTNAVKSGEYIIPDSLDEFIWDFADMFCPEYDQSLDDRLAEIYMRLAE